MENDALPPLPPRKGDRVAPTRKDVTDSKAQALTKAKRSAAGAKRRLTNAQKKIDALTVASQVIDGAATVVTTADLDLLPPTLRETLDNRPVIFEPNPGPQTEFLSATEQEILFGGSAGGGKSYAMLADPLRFCGNPAFRGILFRRTNDELRELIWKSKELYPRAYPGAKWSEQKSQWTFPSGATFWITYLDKDDDVLRYQGQSFTWIGFDEIGQWGSPFPYLYMRSRLRSTAGLPLYMRASANPGGPGSAWLRRMWIDAAPWGTRFPVFDQESGAPLVFPPHHERAGEPLFYCRFIPSRLTDNPHLMRDGQYEANLLSLPEAQRRQLLDGDWDVAEGAAFGEWRRSIHTCAPFEIPATWTRFRAADWGYTSPFCVLWFAIDHDQNLYVYREYYGKKVLADAFAREVLAQERGERIRYGMLDSSVWASRGEVGPPIAEQMIREGCHWRKADRSAGSRVAGKAELHRRLALDPDTGKPRLVVFDTCVNLIRTLPLLPLDKHKPEDVATDGDDHAYDALRYGIMSRPLNPHALGADFFGKASNPYRPLDPVFGY